LEDVKKGLHQKEAIPREFVEKHIDSYPFLIINKGVNI
jgi:hypothetical protein